MHHGLEFADDGNLVPGEMRRRRRQRQIAWAEFSRVCMEIRLNNLVLFIDEYMDCCEVLAMHDLQNT
jgi:hypothetical protein